MEVKFLWSPPVLITICVPTQLSLDQTNQNINSATESLLVQSYWLNICFQKEQHTKVDVLLQQYKIAFNVQVFYTCTTLFYNLYLFSLTFIRTSITQASFNHTRRTLWHTLFESLHYYSKGTLKLIQLFIECLRYQKFAFCSQITTDMNSTIQFSLLLFHKKARQQYAFLKTRVQ